MARSAGAVRAAMIARYVSQTPLERRMIAGVSMMSSCGGAGFTGHHVIIWYQRLAYALREDEIGFNRADDSATALE